MRPIYIASNKKFQGVENLDLLKIDYLDMDIDIKNYDAFIFTSKNGVKSFADKYNLENIQTYAISKVTSDELLKFGADVKFIGKSGHGDKFAEELIPYLKDKRCLYVRAKKVVSNLVAILTKNGIDCDTVISYETNCSNNIKNIKDNSIIIFSSPSTIKCFFNLYEWKSSYHAIAIGETTKKYIPQNINYTVSDKQTIENCIKIAKTLS